MKFHDFPKQAEIWLFFLCLKANIGPFLSVFGRTYFLPPRGCDLNFMHMRQGLVKEHEINFLKPKIPKLRGRTARINLKETVEWLAKTCKKYWVWVSFLSFFVVTLPHPSNCAKKKLSLGIFWMSEGYTFIVHFLSYLFFAPQGLSSRFKFHVHAPGAGWRTWNQFFEPKIPKLRGSTTHTEMKEIVVQLAMTSKKMNLGYLFSIFFWMKLPHSLN